MTVDDSTGSRFLNLIAYEMCPDNFRTKYEVTSYISFLESLIDYPDDVKELRSAHILHNLLGCDKEVAQLFNEIGTDLVPNTEVYNEVILQVQSHYKSNGGLPWLKSFTSTLVVLGLWWRFWRRQWRSVCQAFRLGTQSTLPDLRLD